MAAELKTVPDSPTPSLDKLLVKGIYDAQADIGGRRCGSSTASSTARRNGALCHGKAERVFPIAAEP